MSKYWPLIGVIAFSWGIAFFEYCCQVPANRIGFQGQHLQWNHLAAFVCLIVAVYFVFMK